MNDILLNGVVVGQYEPTGDTQKDMEFVRAFLREKGLAREITKTDATHGQADAFAALANSIYIKDLRRSPFNGRSVAPFIVNAVFSVELYLKAIHSAYGQEARGHDLVNLYQAIPEAGKVIFQQAARDMRSRYKLEPGADIDSCLESIRKAFEQWRYLYESNRMKAELQAVRYVMHVAHETCCRVRKQTET